jgi:hypothetical protein
VASREALDRAAGIGGFRRSRPAPGADDHAPR